VLETSVPEESSAFINGAVASRITRAEPIAADGR
jgi:hypothetical protein